MQKTVENQPKVGEDSGAQLVRSTPSAPLTAIADEVSDDMADSDSTPGKSPAFQFYPKDFITDERVQLMSLAERGAYITLICRCWTEGTLPADPLLLSRLCGISIGAFRKLWPAIQPCFRVCSRDDSRLVHPRLERERQKQRAFRKKQAENGRLGGRPANPKKPKPLPECNPVANPEQSSASPISDLRSTDFSQKHTSVRVFPPPRDRSPAECSDDENERAARFLERYAVLYQQHRKGARYVSKPTLDYQEALQLVQTWDDARLEQIAKVFLTTDHEFAEKGSRTMAQFRAMASWCDSRLIEAGIA